MTNAGSDLELVRLIRRGDERAARELWARVGPSLRAIARVVLRSDAGSEDVAQQTMCRLLELTDRQIREIRDVGAFLACVARRLALNELRGEGRSRRREARATQHAASGAPSPPGEHSPDERRLRDAIASLPDELAEIVILRHIAGLTFEQLALSLDQNRSTIAGRHRRAMEELERILGRSDAPPEVQERVGAAR